jgi:adenosylcobinamide-GDP ribazoletransferase
LGLAVTFLTRIPFPLEFVPEPEDWGQSVLFFPVVGFVIGALLTMLAALFATADAGVLAALLIMVWALITGGLHLDGLADTADAWIGGFGDREKTLRIMKDPRSGSIAIMVMVLVLLGKFAALEVILASQNLQALLIVPVLGRAAILFLLITTPYARATGIGVAHAKYLPRGPAVACIYVLIGIMVLLFAWRGLWMLLVLGVGLLGLRRLLMARLGGVTGDTLGAACELTELSGLMLLALWI